MNDQLIYISVSIPSFTVHPVCSDNEFRCSNGFCIPTSKLCDLKNDCADRLDEVGCGKCCLLLLIKYSSVSLYEMKGP